MTLNHTVYDCATGKTTEIPFTKAEQREWDRARAADTGEDPDPPCTESERLVASLITAQVLDPEVAAKVLRVDRKRIDAATAELAAEPPYPHLPPPPSPK